MWFICRKHTITASIAHRINNAHKKKNYEFRVRALIAKQNYIPKYIPAMLYGQEMENKAIEDYLDKYRKEHINLRCIKMGLMLYERMPVIGASLDGLLVCDCC